MCKNIIIVLLFAILLVSLFVNFRKCQINAVTEYGHPRPKSQFTYGVRDPYDDKIKLVVYATEWTNGEWALTVLSKTEDNKVYRFWTMPPNDPSQWMSDKLDSPESMESKPISMEVLDRGNDKFGPCIWMKTWDSHNPVRH